MVEPSAHLTYGSKTVLGVPVQSLFEINIVTRQRKYDYSILRLSNNEQPNPKKQEPTAAETHQNFYKRTTIFLAVASNQYFQKAFAQRVKRIGSSCANTVIFFYNSFFF